MKSAGVSTSLRPAAHHPLRVLYWGMEGPFSRAPLAALIAAGMPICGLIIPAAGGKGFPAGDSLRRIYPPAREPAAYDLPIATPYVKPTTVHLAWAHDIPVFAVRRLSHPVLQTLLASLEPDIACVACFPRRIPPALLEIPAHGFLNVHPSLLPAYRGPAPLFWTFRNGDTQTGVTVHFMDHELDTGDIARQAVMQLLDGVSGPEADARLGRLGAELLVATVAALAHGSQTRTPQPPGGSYYTYPTVADFCLDTGWPARRAYNFMCGTCEWGTPYAVDVGARQIMLDTAITYDPRATLNAPYTQDGDVVEIQFTPGTLTARGRV